MQVNNKKFSCLAALLVFLAIWCCKSAAVPDLNIKPHMPSFPTLKSEISIRKQPQIPGLKSEVYALALKAYNNARAEGIGTKDILTVVDYSMPSTAKRMWVIDMRTNKVLFNTLVAHGQGSGNNYATRFSNKHGSRQSSIGLFVTSYIYQGHWGRSLNVKGLEEKFNSNAEARRVVFHRAHYVDESIIKQIGRLGRSFGCWALNTKVADKVMNTIKDGTLVFCYYPDSKWLKESKYL